MTIMLQSKPGPTELTKQGPRLPAVLCNRKTGKSMAGKVLLDTGARYTFIDTDVVDHLALPEGEANLALGLDGVFETVQILDFSVEFVDPQGERARHDFDAVAGDYLKHFGIDALIGRDLLRHTIFSYDGVAGITTLQVISNSDHGEPPTPLPRSDSLDI